MDYNLLFLNNRVHSGHNGVAFDKVDLRHLTYLFDYVVCEYTSITIDVGVIDMLEPGARGHERVGRMSRLQEVEMISDKIKRSVLL